MKERVIKFKPKEHSVMYQTWKELLFIHWPVDENLIRPHIPAGLDIDTFDGVAYLTLTPLLITNVRPPYFPPLPFLSTFDELNFRTYVIKDNEPGIWFFSLDANSLLTVFGAQTFFSLPYKYASIDFDINESSKHFSSKRQSAEAEFNAKWKCGSKLPPASPSTLDHFLSERYCLYTKSNDHIYQARIFHKQWELYECSLQELSTTVPETHSLPNPKGELIVRCGGTVDVEVWPLHQVDP